MLILDSAKSHFTEEVQKQIKNHSKIGVIPGAYKITAALKIFVNKSFKNNLRILSED